MKAGMNLLLFVCLALGMTGCGSDGDSSSGGEGEVVIEKLRFGSDVYDVEELDWVKPDLYVTLQGHAGSEELYDFKTDPYQITLTADNTDVVSIEEEGRIGGVKRGATIVKARSPRYTGYANTVINVLPPVRFSTLYFEKDLYIADTEENFTPQMICRMSNEKEEHPIDMKKYGHRLEWTLEDASIAQVDEMGQFKALKDGATRVVVSSKWADVTPATQVLFVDRKADQWLGEWVLSDKGDNALLAGKLYMSLKKDNSFEWYQNINTPAGFKKFIGTYTMDKKGEACHMSGKYDDNSALTQEYELTFEKDVIRMKGLSDGLTQVFVRTVIPDFVKDEAEFTPRSVSRGTIEPLL